MEYGEKVAKESYVIMKSGAAFGMKKFTEEKCQKVLTNKENKEILDGFLKFNFNYWLFALKESSEMMQFFMGELPPLTLVKQKCLLIFKNNADKEMEFDDDNTPANLCTMEITKNVLENLSAVTHDVYLPILSNPKNQVGWSDLVSKDLMDKFNLFLAQIYVTIGQVKGRTLLPLPASDITSDENKSNKDKAHILEASIITWTRQIKNVLKQDPESALKAGNNPGPQTELDFWNNKKDNLNSIHSQLQSNRIKQVIKFLEQNKSTYTGPFGKLQKDVSTARTEANDNYKYLITLESLFGQLTSEGGDFLKLPDLFVPIMHTILLIWKHSQYYNSPNKLVVLIREICNAIIEQAFKFINKEMIFGYIAGETPKDAHDKLSQTLDVCSKFKEAYFEYKAKADNEWKITTNALFVRLDSFAERCQDIMHLTSTIIQFNKLQRIEIGGTKGKALTATVMHIFNEFNKAVDDFMLVEYEIMEISVRKFDDDFFQFRQKIKDLERMLASILNQGFDDSDTIIGKFKLLDSFEGLLTRPIIQDELEKKHITLLELYKEDLKITQGIFLEGKALVDRVDERAPISDNMPPITGAIYWTTGLFERIKEPNDKLSSLSQAIQDREEYKDVQKLYQSLCKNLREFEDSKIKVWEDIVEMNTEDKLDMYLLTRDEPETEGDDGFANVNFDLLLVRLLREVKYLLLLGLDVPGRAQKLYEKVNVYRTQAGNLDLIVGMYNGILRTLLPVEKPLLASRIIKMNQCLQPGIDDLKWNRSIDDIDPFIEYCMDTVTLVDQLVKKMKENVKEMQKMMAEWAEQKLFERKNKPLPPDDLEQTHKSIIEPKLLKIKDEGKEIHKKMKDTMDNIKPDKKGVEWLSYVDYVNSLIIEGVTIAICSSMDFLSDNISIEWNKKQGLQPMFDVKIDLVEGELSFDPPVSSVNSVDSGIKSIKDIVLSIVADFIDVAQKMARLDTGGGDYMLEVKDQFSIYLSLNTISANMDEIKHETDEFIAKYEEFSFLWRENLEESFAAFIDSGVMPSHTKKVVEVNEDGEGDDDEGEEEEDESYKWMADKILTGVQVKKPSLDKFDEKITYLTTIKNKINDLTTTNDIGWLKVNSKPLKEALRNIINSWIKKYTNFLLDNTLMEIENIRKFISDVSFGIKEVPEQAETKAEKDLLMTVMTHLSDVKMIKDHTLNEVEPMKQSVLLLKKHGVEMEEDLIIDLENQKTKLTEVSETALGPVKEKILPLQNYEANNIKNDLDKFKVQIDDFRADFRKNCPYNVEEANAESIDESYQKITKYYEGMVDFEEEAKSFNKLETLFELQKSNYKELKDCRNELLSLKYMWDLVGVIEMLFTSWRSTLWDKIDTDDLLMKIKEMQKKQTNPLNPANKEIKNWKAFSGLNAKVANMGTVLPLISELHSPFMMDRHWRRLMTITSKNINFTAPGFCLEDLIQLELFKFADEVSELVDSANKEAKIETKLNTIESIWEVQKLEFLEYKDTFVIGALDETIEFVETHAMELMGMLTQKDVEEFKERVLKWQKALKAVDAILTIWMKVQRNWQRLETIFLASEDIKAQLPDDTKRFTKVDIEWKDLMREAAEDPLVINACTADGRFAILVDFFNDIETCEKSLNDYLEQKKKMFPRFYFVSNQALLDILSNGNNPEKVGGYLGDCFDGLNKMDWAQEDNRPWRRSKGMFSKENEYIPFGSDFSMNGAVESYLTELEAKMRSTLTDSLVLAKTNADNWEIDKGRSVWLEDYSAQIALVTTQIMWTEEVIRVFDDAEGGSETAMKEYLDLSISRIGDLIERVRHPMSGELRDKIITIITIDVHARDVIERFFLQKIIDPQAFAWQSQLKFRFEKDKGDDCKICYPEIADWTTKYSYEYVGNCGRLVITPLTDRCYITLTQALNLTMGGAPAGPAGTGKTETTKDLGRALGLPVMVFNCSDQMNYSSMAQIFMGLSQTGAWGCFDEFNRILIEVLSVVSTQIQSCLEALKEYKIDNKKNVFVFQEEEIKIVVTTGFFITMNPGYAGRTELPENLKALFRSCAMVTPDIILICENMLMSEGFNTAKELSNKFMTLYELCKSLLSKQTHYDWGLRAVKSVLRQAGKLKRADPDIVEDFILMRALRDFNLPKIIFDDVQIFLGLIKDLFPGIEVETRVDPEEEEAVQQCAIATKLQTDDGFVKKCVNLSEILDVRHSCFIIGNPGACKSMVWKTLALAETRLGRETIYEIIDPKAVSSDELFGCMNPKTKEWKDGVLSTIMRDMNRLNPPFKESQVNKWIILDGDIDPEWIESLNTVMDDNKVLTLVSQERIPLTASMRLILEVSHLRNATPATVSRGGVLFINDADIGWTPYVQSWMDQFKNNGDEIARTVFDLCFRNYVSDNFQEETKNKETIAPMVEIAYIQTLTTIIDFMYQGIKSNKAQNELMTRLRAEDEDAVKIIYESFFVFAMMWSFGGALPEDLKTGFSNSIKHQAKALKFPDSKDLCFQFYYDLLEQRWVNWEEKVAKYEYDEDVLFDSIVVPTTETAKNNFLLGLHIKMRKPLLYIGTAGTAKTTYINDFFNIVDKETTITENINFNSYTDSAALQAIMEDKVERRAGKSYGPPPNHVLIYFMDDLNMPKVDKYGTQSPICLIRQVIDYALMYNREALEEKKLLVDVLFTACQNPKSGSFFVDPRLQRHYTVVACDIATDEVLETIFLQICDAHFSKFDPTITKLAPKLVKATTILFKKMVKDPTLRPTARKFHYQFNLRDFAKIVQNLTLSMPNLYKQKPDQIGRLWVHECHRVYLDRLLFEKDIDIYWGALKDGSKQLELTNDEIFREPNVFTSFITASKGHEKAYIEIQDVDELKKVLEDKLYEYNQSLSAMNLVLFMQAMEHVCRIARIIDQPSGNALLIGVGGSGKQSLSKLAAFILESDVYRIMPNATYGMAEFRVDLETMFTKAGCTGQQLLFILTDSQITQEIFLVYINDLLSSGWVPDMFPKEEKDAVLQKVRNEAKSAGYMDTPDQLFEFFLEKTKRNLHCAICFSPVGDSFRFRARQFPAIINCTSIDWFHEWPKDALIDVAGRFLADLEIPNEEIRENIGLHMAFVHLSIEEANAEFLEKERRHNYTTPTSFLELINFYKALLIKKQSSIKKQSERLQIGLATMESTTKEVDKLKAQLVEKMVEVREKQEDTNKLIKVVTAESEIAAGEQEKANVEEEATTSLADNASQIKGNADKELEEALPAMQKAQNAVDCLDKAAIGELKGFAKPHPLCVDVSTVTLILLKGEMKNFGWNNAQKMMGNPVKFIDEVKAFRGEEIEQKRLDKCADFLKKDTFNHASMVNISSAAANLCEWAVNIVGFNTIYRKVKPLMDSAAEAEQQVKDAEVKLKIVQDNVAEINAQVAELQAKLDEAIETKERVEAEAQAFQDQLDLAERLVNGLADENARWKLNVKSLSEEEMTMIGDALLSAAFVSYIAPFNSVFRNKLWREGWLPDLVAKKIPGTDGVDPLNVLATVSDQAIWKKEGLPADRVSLENASVVTSCSRWPLIIDPQLQGIKWIREREGSNLKVIQLSQRKWMNEVENALTMGITLLIEAVGEEIDAMLDPLLSRAFIVRGKSKFIKLGSEEIDYDPKFKLYLQTKLSNPHYKPETAAQCTIINFIVTESGLEDQLLALVVQEEKPDLEQTKAALVKEQNEFMIELARLEEELLTNLSNADPATILQNTALIESLEVTKQTSQEISEKQKIAVVTEENINVSRNIYRRVATEGAMLYFLLIQLEVVDHMYQYSLESFTTFFFKAFERTEQFEEEEKRVLALRLQIRMTIYQWVARGLFERHKQILRAQICFRLMMKKIIQVPFKMEEFNFLIYCPSKIDSPNPLPDWLPDMAWYTITKLIDLEEFEKFAHDLSKEAPPRFKDWYNELSPEDEKLPLDWKRLESMPFQKLLVLRCMRPDRLTIALDNFIGNTLPQGDAYVNMDSSLNPEQVLQSSIANSNTFTPIFFILSPGANPVKDVVAIGRKMGIDMSKNFHNIALGQGQDIIAMNKLEIAHKEGHWVMLQNIHLMPSWLLELEKKLDDMALEGSNPSFRLFMSADPSPGIPIGILERSIKLTNEPPTGLKQNMQRAFAFFTKEDFDERESKIKTILFGLCYFHSVLVERRKFGPKGWNMQYPFSMGDLRDSAKVLSNYMEGSTSGKVPWPDLKYIFGEIMYGGHIVDGWDRVLCMAYLDNMLDETLLDEAELLPFVEGKGISFKIPPAQNYEKYIEHIEFELPPETPLAFGMHPNVEIDFRTTQCVVLMKTMQELQTDDGGDEEDGAVFSKNDKALEYIAKLNDEVNIEGNKPNVEDIASKLGEDRKPAQNVLIQECEYMNVLIEELMKSVSDLQLAFKGELTMTDQMEALIDAMFLDRIPATWAKLAYPSSRGLISWMDNLKHRLEMLNIWKEDPTDIPKVMFLNRLFNPQSFLTCIKQQTSRDDQKELNRLFIKTEVTKKMFQEIEAIPKDGAYVFGFHVDGARWDTNVGQLEESFPKRQYSVMPVILCKAVELQDGAKEDKNIYQCPVYKTDLRFTTYVFTAQFRTKFPSAKWVIAGVCGVLDVEGIADAFLPEKQSQQQ